MAYDEVLAQRIRDRLSAHSGVVEKKMFGGLAFLVNGNMAVAASAGGGALVRVDPAEMAKLVTTTPAEVMIMRGREMPDWLRVKAEDLGADTALEQWAERGARYARSLPPK